MTASLTNALVKAQNFLPNVEKEGGRVKVDLNKLQDWYGEASLTWNFTEVFIYLAVGGYIQQLVDFSIDSLFC